MSIVKCKSCGTYIDEDRSLEYNDNHFCGLRCKAKKEREDDETISRPLSRAARVYR